jgi:hypothetical protein
LISQATDALGSIHIGSAATAEVMRIVEVSIVVEGLRMARGRRAIQVAL